MASFKVIASRSPPNPEHPRQPSPSGLHLHSDQSRGFGSMNIDDFLRTMYSEPETLGLEGGGGEAREGGRSKMVEEVWRDIVGHGGGGSGESAVTLEDFLAKAGAVSEEDVRVPAGAFGLMDTSMMSTPATGVPAVQFGRAVGVQSGFGVDFESGMVAVGSGGRGKRKAAVEEAPLDKATQQRQKRMIKNRESAARSRERKQAYNVELENLISQLEEDNARLLREEAELNKKRYKQLMETLIPVVEKPRPPRAIKRVHSMEW